MPTLPFEGSPDPVRSDLVDAHERAWAAIAAPGTWLSGEQRVAVAAEVPQDQGVVLRQGLDLAIPHSRCRGVAVRQQQDRAAAVGLVVELDAVVVEHGHFG